MGGKGYVHWEKVLENPVRINDKSWVNRVNKTSNACLPMSVTAMLKVLPQ